MRYLITLLALLAITGAAVARDLPREAFLKLDPILTALASGKTDAASRKLIATLPNYFGEKIPVTIYEPYDTRNGVARCQSHQENFSKDDLNRAVNRLLNPEHKEDEKADRLLFILCMTGRRQNQPLARHDNTWRWWSGMTMPKNTRNSVSFSRKGIVSTISVTFLQDE